MSDVKALFAYDLAQLMSFTAAVMPDTCSIALAFNVGTYVNRSRTELLLDALTAHEKDPHRPKVTHILWLDADMRFPRDAAIRLLKHQLPFVGINYSTRRMPPEFVGIKEITSDEDPKSGAKVETLEDSTGLEPVDALGFGCFMMEAAALVNLPDPRYDPWFFFEMTKWGNLMGEDVYFCQKMVKETLKERIFVDHDLSKECSHIGDFEYKIYHPWETNAARKALEALEAAEAAVEGDDAEERDILTSYTGEEEEA
jgi:hypothetical protein